MQIKLIPAFLMLVLVPAAVFACSASSSEDSEAVTTKPTTSSVAPLQTAQPAPTCDFKCQCEKKGGTVSKDRANWCCKGLSCTSAPEDIVVWVQGEELPPVEKYPHTVLWLTE
jgi:hypothetical protein